MVQMIGRPTGQFSNLTRSLLVRSNLGMKANFLQSARKMHGVSQQMKRTLNKAPFNGISARLARNYSAVAAELENASTDLSSPPEGVVAEDWVRDVMRVGTKVK